MLHADGTNSQQQIGIFLFFQFSNEQQSQWWRIQGTKRGQQSLEGATTEIFPPQTFWKISILLYDVIIPLYLEHQHQKILSYSISSQKATLLLISYHFTIPSASQKSIFIKILFFNISLLFLSNRHFFFQNLAWINFPWLSNSIFFPQSPSTSSIGSTHRATHTDPDERIKEIRYKTQTTTYNQRQPGKPTSNEWTHIPIQEMKEAHIAKYQNQSKNTKLYS